MNGTGTNGVALVNKPMVIVATAEGYFVFLVVGDDDLVDGGGVFEGKFGVGGGNVAGVVVGAVVAFE